MTDAAARSVICRCRGGERRWCGSGDGLFAATVMNATSSAIARFEGGLTRRLARGLVADAKVMSIRSVVRRHGLDWHLIQALVTSWSALVAGHRRSRRCRVLLVDETSMRKRHRYVTVIQDGETGQILAMVEHRNAEALKAFFVEQGPRWCRGVQVVVSDGSKSYKAAIDAHLGHAKHVLDRFHVVRWFAESLTLVRRDLQRREPAGVKPAGRTPTCSGPASCCCDAATPSTTVTRAASMSSSANTPRLDMAWASVARTPRPLPRRRPRRRPRRVGPVHRSLRHRRAHRVPRRRQHRARMGRRDPRMARLRPTLQRPNRGNHYL